MHPTAIEIIVWYAFVEILNSLSWYQPLEEQDEYTYHYDQENNLSLYLNIYESRYLHLNLKAFLGKLNFDENEIYLIEKNLNLSNIFKNNSDFIDAVKLVIQALKNRENRC